MKWLKRKLRNWLDSAEYDEVVGVVAMNHSQRPVKRATVSRNDDVESESGLNITVRSAIGGRIVTFRHYDHRTDRTNYKLYVVPEDQDFERELGKMITLESMRG